MELTGIGGGEKLFAYTGIQAAGLESLANNALKKGIDQYTEGKYEEAVAEFKRSIGLSRNSAYAVTTAHYMAEAYLKLDDVDGAIESYKTAIKMDTSRDDSHIKLGNLYFAEERYEDSTREYEEAVRLYPDAVNRYSLGQVYLEVGKYGEAETQFNEVLRLEPQAVNGNFGLGQTFARQGRYEDALREFEQAVALKPEFYDGHAEIGYTYADMGDMDKAQEIVSFLESVDQEDMADSLSRYMYRVDPPKFMFAHSASTFRSGMGMKTPVSSLDSYLETASAEKTFTVKFQFDKAMNRESVENIFNWQISRSTGQGPGQAYNFALSIPDTETKLPPLPQAVTYDAEMYTATVYFKVKQNADANATIDPSHIQFKFNGKDVYGNAMDPDFDEYTGFSGVA